MVGRAEPVIQQVEAEDDEQRRPVAGEDGEADDVRGIEEQDEAEPDQQNGADGSKSVRRRPPQARTHASRAPRAGRRSWTPPASYAWRWRGAAVPAPRR